MDMKVWQWERSIDSHNFLISSNPNFLSHAFVQEAFATEEMFWANPMSALDMRVMLSNSLTLGLYLVSGSGTKKPIGMARFVTDYTTLAYLTDVFLQPEYRNLGLGKWMIHCCRDLALEMPALRFMVLLTGSEKAQNLYRKELGMQLLDGREEPLTCMGVRKAALADVAATAAASQGNRPGGADA